MEIYTEKDISIFNDSFINITNQVKDIQMNTFEPTRTEMEGVMKIIKDFIISNKRKIYGGYALNLLLESKNKNDAIYTKYDVPDIDFYSPDPISDLIQLCNILHEKGYKGVVGKEAMHKETYSIFVNYQLYCDISYVPKNIYNRMPFIEVDKLNSIHPHFMVIDFYRMTTDLMMSSWRVEKTLPRIYKILKYYPLLNIDKPLPDTFINWNSDNKINNILSSIFTFLKNKKSIIVTGLYAYNIFLSALKLNNNKKYKLINIPYYEFISDNYREDVNELLDILKKTYPDEANDIKVIEHYPFFQFYGYNSKIYYKNKMIAWIFDTNKKCLPFQDIPAVMFDGKEHAIKDAQIRLGSFPLTIMMNLMLTIYYRTNKLNDEVNIHQIITSHLFDMRKMYFREHKKNFMDNTLFREYIIDCLGEKVNPIREYFENIEKKKKDKNGPYVFKYEPDKGSKDPVTTYRFANSSGNPINNEKNLRLPEKQNDIMDEENDEQM